MKDLTDKNIDVQTDGALPAPGVAKRRARIILPILILLMIAGIFLVKTLQDRSFPDEAPGDMLALDVTNSFDFEALKSRGLPMFIDFGAEDCPPCQAMRSDLLAIHARYKEDIVIKYIDVWANPEAGSGFPISAVPTQFFFYADGTPYVPPAEYESMFMLYKLQSTEEHALTAHVGGLTEEEMTRILDDLDA